MALNIGEAHAVNTLIRRLLNPTAKVDEEATREAALLLAGSAYKTLAAGITPDSVADLWTVRANMAGEEPTTDRVRLNGPRPLKPSDLPEDGKIEVINSGGEWAAYYYADTDRVYDGSGGGESIEEACRAALDDAQ